MADYNQNGAFDPRRTQRRVWTPEPPEIPVENTRVTQRRVNVTPPPVPPNGTRRINSDNKKPPKWMWRLLVLLLIAAAISWFVSTRDRKPLVFAEEEELIEDVEYPVVDEYESPDKCVEEAVVVESSAKQTIAVVEEYPKPSAPVETASEADYGPQDTIIEVLEEVVVRNDSPQENNERIYTMAMVDQKPSFPGGDAAMYKWLAEHTNYPAQAQEEGVQGRVVVMFDVDKTGQIVNVKIARGRHPALDKEAIRLVKSMPKWLPGRNNGKPVRVTHTLPVTFKLSS